MPSPVARHGAGARSLEVGPLAEGLAERGELYERVAKLLPLDGPVLVHVEQLEDVGDGLEGVSSGVAHSERK